MRHLGSDSMKTLQVHDDMREVLALQRIVADRAPLVALPSAETRRSLREQALITQTDAAAVLGCGLRTFTKWELGEAEPRPSAERRYRSFLALAYDLGQAINNAIASVVYASNDAA